MDIVLELLDIIPSNMVQIPPMMDIIPKILKKSGNIWILFLHFGLSFLIISGSYSCAVGKIVS